jgi:putative tryptophan/tyrosine transport system substrate-binding protein
VFNQRKETVALAAKHRLPIVYPTTEDADAGGLIAYGASSPEQFRQAAVLVDKILQGAKPSDMPVEQPTRFDLVVNRATAKALGLTIPPGILTLADRVIE